MDGCGRRASIVALVLAVAIVDAAYTCIVVSGWLLCRLGWGHVAGCGRRASVTAFEITDAFLVELAGWLDSDWRLWRDRWVGWLGCGLPCGDGVVALLTFLVSGVKCVVALCVYLDREAVNDGKWCTHLFGSHG